MKPLSPAPNLVEQVHDAILGEIAGGQLASGERIIQEQIAKTLGVSRQPVQQALALLRKQGVLQDAPGRGLIVAPLDADFVQHMYEIRAVVEGLACRRAAELNAARAAQQGPALIDAGRKATAGGSLAKLIAADMRFHQFIYGLSGNPLIGPAMAPYWTNTQRVMGEVVTHDEGPHDIWDQHERIVQAIAAGDAEGAETLARAHITLAADYMRVRLLSGLAPA
ncbi:MAG: GntR family transcriptional regulator [Aquincola sp.]|nr:GntR family transcriptional regulator [Aquincola sp.]MDH4290126.1 GntR family transcriptional regulator [Aquincola sp.]MDH5328540.1 GntR family transcriptional regulator [Aquincola sp.]